jgi:spore photoproduct lyase
MIEKYEQGTPTVEQRIAAARKVFQAGYPLGFLIAPIIYGDGWQTEYEQVLLELAAAFQDFSAERRKEITFELISHRYTSRAKTNIAGVFPASDLDMEEQNRRYKYGQFGYGKYIYRPEIMDELKESLETFLHSHFPGARILYFV